MRTGSHLPAIDLPFDARTHGLTNVSGHIELEALGHSGRNNGARELQALDHTVRLMPPVYVKPYLKRQKNDAADAEAICEAVMRPSMRFVRPGRQSSKAV
jgi:transposase